MRFKTRLIDCLNSETNTGASVDWQNNIMQESQTINTIYPALLWFQTQYGSDVGSQTTAVSNRKTGAGMVGGTLIVRTLIGNKRSSPTHFPGCSLLHRLRVYPSWRGYTPYLHPLSCWRGCSRWSLRSLNSLRSLRSLRRRSLCR